MMKEDKNKKKKKEQDSSAKHMSFRSIIGGDILANDFLRRQTKLIILIMVLTVLYIDNRYSAQQELIEIDKLKKEISNMMHLPDLLN